MPFFLQCISKKIAVKHNVVMQCVTLCVKREIFVSDSVAAQRNVPVFKMETNRGRLAAIVAAPALTNIVNGAD